MFPVEGETTDFSESELAQILIKQRLPYLLYDIDHTDVTAIIESISVVMPTLTFAIIEITDRKFIDLDLASILIHHIWLYFTCIETYSDSKSLENTSRLIG